MKTCCILQEDYYLELVLFDAFGVGTEPVSLQYTEFLREFKKKI